MASVVAPFHRLPLLLVSNVYVLDGGPGNRWLIDSGHWSERLQLLAALRATGFTPSQLTGVLLTHRHSDHAGNAAFLQQRFGLKILAHQEDALVLDGSRPRFPLGRSGTLLERAFGTLENHTAARLKVDQALVAGDQVAGLEVHAVPGHTEGSVLYRHAATGALLSGDTLLTARPPLTLFPDILPAWASYCVDVAQAHASLAAFHDAGWPYEHLLAGHGRPLVGNARRRVMDALAASAALAQRS